MKKKNIIFPIIILAIIFISGNVFAQVVTTQRKINTQQETQQIKPQQKTYPQKSYRKKTSASVSKPVVVNRLSSSIKTCKPYTENMKSDYLGMNFIYEVKIEGWVNNKCRLNFTAKTNGTSSSFKNLYGVDASDATILSFAPKIRCDFTREQLAYVGDSLLQEEERNRGARNNMLKDPNNITFDGFSSSDMRLLDVVLNQQACRILNTGDLNNMMQNLMLY